MRGLFAPELAAQLPRASRTYGSVLRGHPLSFAVFRQAPWHHYGLLALEESQLSVRTPYLDNEFVATLFRAPERAVAGPDVSVRLIADGDPRLLDVETDRAVQPRRPESSSIGRAVREFSFKAEYAYDYGMPQWLARIDHALSPLRLERLFLGRHKFYHYRVWYRDALARFVRDTLLDSVALSRPYVERRAVEAIVNGHLRGGRNHTLEIHRLLTLELFHRLFVDRRPARRSARVLIHAC
jgi:asparagine synthase (glutamine-hydrolysing)